MTMTKSRRAAARPKTVVDPLDVLTDDDEFFEHFREMRDAASEEFRYFRDAHAGDKGDRKVAYTQRMHWAFLDMAAANNVTVRALLRSLKDMGGRLAKAEDSLRKAKGLMTKSASPEAAPFEIEQGEDGRTFTFKSAAGDQSFTIPAPIFRGAWKEGETYSHGDTVVWGGSSWSAMRQTSNRPDAPESGWMISARRGRDGKDARTPA